MPTDAAPRERERECPAPLERNLDSCLAELQTLQQANSIAPPALLKALGESHSLLLEGIGQLVAYSSEADTAEKKAKLVAAHGILDKALARFA